ncbi:MAG: glycosyltransferase family 2 protein [Bdellovibrionaceae bacterium]|nr:glycosyltransferase family 2 protein [Pseudobdellovibrionaceae bacterium]
MDNHQVDIVLPYHNGSKFIEAQLDSIQKAELRSETKLHVLVIDDGSRADEFEFLTTICARFTNVTIYRNEANLGCIKSFERGLSLSSAQYVMTSDQDDIWMPDKIQRSLDLLRSAERTEAALVFTDLCVVDQNLDVLRTRMLALENFQQSRDKYRILFQNIVAGCTIIVNRKLLEMALPFPSGIPMHDHWLAVCAAFGGRIEMLNEPMVLYRQHDNNLVGSPMPRLLYRIMTPRASLSHLHQSLRAKSELADRLAERMEASGRQRDVERVRQVSLAFRQRTPKRTWLSLLRSAFSNLAPSD